MDTITPHADERVGHPSPIDDARTDTVGDSPEHAAHPRPPTTRRTSRSRPLVLLAIGAAAVAIATGAVASLAGTDGAAPPPATRAPVDEREVLRGLVERGLVPAESLEPAAVVDERGVLRGLVERGLIPAESLEPSR